MYVCVYMHACVCVCEISVLVLKLRNLQTVELIGLTSERLIYHPIVIERNLLNLKAIDPV